MNRREAIIWTSDNLVYCCIYESLGLDELTVCQEHVYCEYFGENDQGAVSIRKTVLPGMAIPMLKIRRPNGRLIFNMEITIRR